MIADCVRSHVSWITLEASAEGGATGTAGSVDWAYVPGSGTMHLLFPEDPPPSDVESITAEADGLGATATVLWAARDARRPWLRTLGFGTGWQPWWMQASAARAAREAGGGRAGLVTVVREHDSGRAHLQDHPDVLLAEAAVDGAYAGCAWMHLDGDLAGLYDMAVWPDFQRRGLGRELVGVLAAEAERRGVSRITLNATPEGATLYAACGFRMLGAGRTWWRHAER